MPELPEVEVYCRYFAKHALRKKISRVRVLDARILGTRSLAPLRGRSFRAVRRHGKHLFADAGTTWLHLHFGMSGDLAYYTGDEQPRFARVVFDFVSGAHLAFEDMRLFGVVDLTPSPEEYIEEHRLGPDPLEISLRQFRERLSNRRGAIKAVLMSQDVIAGVGNLYADETLFQTSIHPKRTELSSGEVRDVYNVMRRILRETTARKLRGASYPPAYLIPHREEGERCPRRGCGGIIKRTTVIGRTTYFCPRHQP